MKCLNIRKLNICAFSIIILVLFSFNVKKKKKNTNVYKQLNMFGEVYERVRREYVEEVSDKELIEAAIQGMLQSLDPHSSFMNSETFDDMQVQTKGEFGGLGIEVSMEDSKTSEFDSKIMEEEEIYESGKTVLELIMELEKKMLSAAKNLDFEIAAELRDRIKGLREKDLKIIL